MEKLKKQFARVLDALEKFFFIRDTDRDLDKTVLLDREQIKKELIKHGIA